MAAMDAPTTYLDHKQTRLIVWGVLLPLFMGSIDNTILASALPTIGHDFGDVQGLPWLITIYLLAATAAMPLYGKIADIHGRRFALYVAIALHMAGSLVCALAPTMFVLILGPAVRFGFGGSVALSLLMIPTVVRSTEEMLRLVPDDLREAAYALGVPKWRTISKVVLPTALGGIVTGVMLAISRVIG